MKGTGRTCPDDSRSLATHALNTVQSVWWNPGSAHSKAVDQCIMRGSAAGAKEVGRFIVQSKQHRGSGGVWSCSAWGGICQSMPDRLKDFQLQRQQGFAASGRQLTNGAAPHRT